MEWMTKMITEVNDAVNGFVWGPVMLVVFLAVGLMFTIRTKFFQITHFKLWMTETFISIFKKKDVRRTKDKASISQFQALATALAATVGTGNIAGVATALALGGPGAIFWMWLSAFLGMMTNYAENTLGIHYRYRNEKGNWVGGAMIYIERGLGWKWLAVIFSVFCLMASFGIGNLTQVNSIAHAMETSFFVPPVATGIVIALLVGLVIVGGIKRIASVTEKIVPCMVIAYLVGGLVCVGVHANQILPAFKLIFQQAFSFQSAAGGVAGYGMMLAVKRGISRGVFSNEAGLGSSVMVHSASNVKEPVVQGMWGVFEVFADTIVVCTITALVILTSGVYDMNAYLAELTATGDITVLPNGVALTTAAFAQTFGKWGGMFISISLMMFAFSTILGWSYYGERAVEYLFGLRAVPVYKIFFSAFVVVGALTSLNLVWDISDTFNGLMAIPNLLAVTLLSSQVVRITRDYMQRRKNGELTPAFAPEETVEK